MTNFIDFNDLSAGTVVDNEFRAEGVTISAAGGANVAMVFDTDNPTGGDYDLATSNLGNVLIISEDGDSSDPDDNGSGGTFFVNFDSETSVESLTLLDVEERAWIRFFDADGNLIDQVDAQTSNNGQVVVNFDVEGVVRMEVVLAGSGAIDNLVFTSAPDLDGFVEGTDGNDLIDAGFLGDPEGDRIDNNDEILPGEGPQDLSLIHI